MKFMLIPICSLAVCFGLNANVYANLSNESKNADRFLTALASEQYENIQSFISEKDKKDLKNRIVAISHSEIEEKAREAFELKIFNSEITLDEVDKYSENELFTILVRSNFSSIRTLSSFSIIGSVCESDVQCYVVSKVKYRKQKYDDDMIKTIVMEYDGNDWRVSVDYFGFDRLIDIFSRKVSKN